MYTYDTYLFNETNVATCELHPFVVQSLVTWSFYADAVIYAAGHLKKSHGKLLRRRIQFLHTQYINSGSETEFGEMRRRL